MLLQALFSREGFCCEPTKAQKESISHELSYAVDETYPEPIGVYAKVYPRDVAATRVDETPAVVRCGAKDGLPSWDSPASLKSTAHSSSRVLAFSPPATHEASEEFEDDSSEAPSSANGDQETAAVRSPGSPLTMLRGPGVAGARALVARLHEEEGAPPAAGEPPDDVAAALTSARMAMRSGGSGWDSSACLSAPSRSESAGLSAPSRSGSSEDHGGRESDDGDAGPEASHGSASRGDYDPEAALARRFTFKLRRFLAATGFRGVNARRRTSLLTGGFTYPLHAAVAANDFEAVQALMWAGSDRRRRDSQNCTAPELARKLNRDGSRYRMIHFFLQVEVARAGE